MATPLVVVTALYLNANATEHRVRVVDSLGQKMQLQGGSAKPIVETLRHALTRSLGRTVVLWVDDTQSNEQEKGQLEEFGLCFINARNTPEAIAYLTANPKRFSVVVTDYDRGNDNARILFDEMRRRGIDLPVIIYGLRFTAEQAKDARSYGFVNQVRYPLELLSEVIPLLPEAKTRPSTYEAIRKAVFGCNWM